MHDIEIYDPRGATEISQLHAPRIADLAGSTVGLLSNDMWQAHRALPLVGELLKQRFPGATVVPATEFPRGNDLIDSEDAVDAVAARGVEAVVVGNAA